MSCAGCFASVTLDDSITCAAKSCKKSFHLLCTKTTKLTSHQRKNWTCPECNAAAKKGGDNSQTPVKTCDNVTIRNKSVRTDTCSPVSPTFNIDDIRDVIREELNKVKKCIITELEESLRHMVKSELKKMSETITCLENSVSFVTEEYDNIKKDLVSKTTMIQQLRTENNNLIETVKNMSTKLENMEQHNRSCNIEIQCVPEHNNENLPSVIKQLSKTVSCELNDADIHHYTRIAKSNKNDPRPRSIVVKLATPRIRDKFLACVITYNKNHSNDKLNTSHIGYGGDKKPIYIAEHLSPANRALHAATRLKAKDKGYKFVWVKQGKIFMRKNETSDHIYVKNIEFLDKIV
ncbi:uncharacterized protein LOC128682569 [Plodia interpunctella]|uniref:uncharacterized protein LOC128682569 n=1 Tax=Plodia interpunctella TaxID=58824 RepID=UPI002368025A|nr:uncharacterized protein LOC128682569 [Plodia interpunctella]